VEGWDAPDISGGPKSRIFQWTIDELVLFLKTGEVHGFVAGGPMADVIDSSLAYLTDADVRAIAVYLKNRA